MNGQTAHISLPYLTPDEEEEGGQCWTDNELCQTNPQLGMKEEGDKAVGKEHSEGEAPTLFNKHLKNKHWNYLPELSRSRAWVKQSAKVPTSWALWNC